MADKLTTEQIAEVKECFSLFDKANEGVVTIDQMCMIFRALGQCPTEAELEKMKEEASPNGRMEIDFPELLSIVAKYYKTPLSEEDVLSAFRKLDENNRGVITLERLRILLTSHAEIMDKEEIE
jgi:calmodulin